MNINKEVVKRGSRELENRFFYFYFLNYDISLNNQFPCIRFHITVENIHMEGTESHISYLCPNFHFMKSRKMIIEKL